MILRRGNPPGGCPDRRLAPITVSIRHWYSGTGLAGPGEARCYQAGTGIPVANAVKRGLIANRVFEVVALPQATCKVTSAILFDPVDILLCRKSFETMHNVWQAQ